ncbi:hypothetical protein IWQ56_000606 [Coemansia nantahalensis]|nr:hypothetical protein IWQ56_000606 [Coemansia nantahalensis]
MHHGADMSLTRIASLLPQSVHASTTPLADIGGVRRSTDALQRSRDHMHLLSRLLSRNSIAATEGTVAHAADQAIAIPMPGFFLDPASDHWSGGHSYRQRQRYPLEVITVPASLTKRVHYEVSYDYPKNAISTARYNVVTFLPAQLTAQFSKVANIYFLFTAALEQVPGWATTGRGSTALPLGVFVSLSIAHEGYDDLRRHRMDRAENTQHARVLKVKVHDRDQVSFSFRDLRHRRSHSVHSFRVRGSQSIHDMGRSTIATVRRWAASVATIGHTAKEAVVKHMAEKRRKRRELEDSDDEDENVDAPAAGAGDVIADGAGSQLHIRLTRGVMSLRSWRGTVRSEQPPQPSIDAGSGPASLDVSDAVSDRDLRRPAIAFDDAVGEASVAGGADEEQEEEAANPLPGNMTCRWKRKRWENVQVGDLVMIAKDEWIPADCIALASTGFDGTCFVETAALDGETTLKQKQALEATNSAIQTAEQLAAFRGFTYVEPPSAELYSFEGCMEVGGERHPLTLNQVLLRGSVLRNTAYVYAQVVYAGEQTRLRRNATRNVRTKAPQIQRITNRIVILVFALLVLLTLAYGGAGIAWDRYVRPRHWYLQDIEMPVPALLVGFLVMMDTLIPISLYVTLEAVKIFQCWFIERDVAMYHAASNTCAEARTTAINEDLGMVRYVFSDKTGTLTENIMKLRAVMCGGFSYQHVDFDRLQGTAAATAVEDPSATTPSRQGPLSGHPAPLPHMRGASASASRLGRAELGCDEDVRDPDLIGPGEAGDPRAHTKAVDDMPASDLHLLPSTRQMMSGPLPSELFQARAEWFLRCLALCHTVQPDRDPLRGRITGYQAASPDEKALAAAAAELGYVMDNRAGQLVQLRVVAPERMHAFNNVAADDDDSCDIGIPAPAPTDRLGSYEVLDVLEFSSTRKRMSVILLCPCGRIVLLTKGADSAIWPRLCATDSLRSDPGDQPFMPRRSDAKPAFQQPSSPAAIAWSGDNGLHHRRLLSEPNSFTGTMGRVEVPVAFGAPTAEEEVWARARALEALHQFSTEGLRTLVYAHREIEPGFYQSWHERYVQATTALANRQQQIEAACEEIERGLLLSGVSAIEDRLQEGVPETIFKLRRAGIRVWMLTGDKIETAINIAKSCRLVETDVVETTALDQAVLDRHPGRMAMLVLQSYKDIDQLDRVVSAALEAAQRMATTVDQRFEARSLRARLRRGLRPFGSMLGASRRGAPADACAEKDTATQPATQGNPSEDLSQDEDTNEDISAVIQTADTGAAGPATKPAAEAGCQTHSAAEAAGAASLAVVVDGETLALLEAHAGQGLLDKFLLLGMLSDAVICSRVSPSQKALVVHRMRVRCEGADKQRLKMDAGRSVAYRWLVRPLRRLLVHDNDSFCVTLAIGDGGNDIAMIQEAHVGVGIAGQEGLQASRAADFSVGQFRFLQRLVLVHGRWSYVRVSLFVMGTFYKCMAFYLAQLVFQFFTGFSGTSLFEGWTLSMYNTLFSILPVLVIGVFEQDLRADTLLDHPELYRDMGPRNHLFTVPEFLRRVVVPGLLHAVVATFLPLATSLLLGENASTNDQFTMGVVVYGILVLTVTLKIAYVDVRRWSLFTHIGVVLMLTAWLCWNGLFSAVYTASPGDGFFVNGIFRRLLGTGAFWLQWIVFAAIPLCLSILLRLAYTIRNPVERQLAAWCALECRQEHAQNKTRRREWRHNPDARSFHRI